MLNLQLVKEVLDKIERQIGNQYCCDCGKSQEKWVSSSNAVLLCRKCAEVHQKMGPEYSRVRELNLDNWTEQEIKVLLLGGNKKFR